MSTGGTNPAPQSPQATKEAGPVQASQDKQLANQIAAKVQDRVRSHLENACASNPHLVDQMKAAGFGSAPSPGMAGAPAAERMGMNPLVMILINQLPAVVEWIIQELRAAGYITAPSA